MPLSTIKNKALNLWTKNKKKASKLWTKKQNNLIKAIDLRADKIKLALTNRQTQKKHLSFKNEKLLRNILFQTHYRVDRKNSYAILKSRGHKGEYLAFLPKTRHHISLRFDF